MGALQIQQHFQRPEILESTCARLFERTIKEAHNGAADRSTWLEGLAETLLPKHHLIQLEKRLPACLDIDRWVSADRSGASLLVCFTYRSANRCIVRKAIVRVAYSKQQGCVELLGVEELNYPLPVDPDELTNRLLHILDFLVSSCN